MRLMVLACAATFGLAQADIPDPPSRVARISYLDGPVSLKPGGVDDWVPALFNRPMTTGEGIWSDAGSRVELSLGTSAIRLSQQTAMSFLALDDNTTQIRLDQGAVEITVKKLDGSERYEVDTPNTAYLLKAPGEYRFDVNEDGQLTALVVRTGVVEAAGGGQKFNVNAPEMARVSGSDSIHYQSGPAPQADDFEEWATSRDQRTEIADQVPQEVIGHEDLDPQGWSADSQYGLAWQPTDVAADWTPYSDGRWVSVQPWGWTWVDSRPWGFATYHYGRWVLIRGHWAWVPGLMGPRPVYAPALVAFVGGPSLGRNVGWFPLGPGEAYIPAYHASPFYVNRLNGTNVDLSRVNAANMSYMNRGHVTLMQRDAFVNARTVQQGRAFSAPNSFAGMRVLNPSSIQPVRASILGYDHNPAYVAHPPAALVNRSVVVRNMVGTSRLGGQRVTAAAPVQRPVTKAENKRIQPQQQAQSKFDAARQKQAAKAQQEQQKQIAKQQQQQKKLDAQRQKLQAKQLARQQQQQRKFARMQQRQAARANAAKTAARSTVVVKASSKK